MRQRLCQVVLYSLILRSQGEMPLIFRARKRCGAFSEVKWTWTIAALAQWAWGGLGRNRERSGDRA